MSEWSWKKGLAGLGGWCCEGEEDVDVILGGQRLCRCGYSLNIGAHGTRGKKLLRVPLLLWTNKEGLNFLDSLCRTSFPTPYHLLNPPQDPFHSFTSALNWEGRTGHSFSDPASQHWATGVTSSLDLPQGQNFVLLHISSLEVAVARRDEVGWWAATEPESLHWISSSAHCMETSSEGWITIYSLFTHLSFSEHSIQPSWS